MIRSFRHKGLRRFFEAGDARGIDVQLSVKLGRQLTLLNESGTPEDMDLPGFKLHPLTGQRAGESAVWVSANWRLVFAFDGHDATDVDLVGYH